MGNNTDTKLDRLLMMIRSDWNSQKNRLLTALENHPNAFWYLKCECRQKFFGYSFMAQELNIVGFISGTVYEEIKRVLDAIDDEMMALGKSADDDKEKTALTEAACRDIR